MSRGFELPRQQKVPLGPLTLLGYSRSTIASFFYLKELAVLFDAGACSAQSAAATDVFVSHLHIDHAQALCYYASHRNMIGMAPGRIHVPVGTGPSVRSWIDQLAALQGANGGRFDYELHEIADGQERPLKGRHFVRAFAADHGLPALGFTVFRRSEKLLPEFANLESAEIGRHKRDGHIVTRVVNEPVFTYLGDTSAKVFDDHPEVGESRVLLAECTFVAPEHVDNARETKHLHVRDFARNAALIRSEKVVLTHFSMRYTDNEIREGIRRGLPEALWSRVELLV